MQFGKITPADFILPANPIIDTNANAVILGETGSVHFIGNKNGWFSYVYKKQVRIKLLNKKAFDLATQKVLLYGTDDRSEKLSDVAGSTYNLENGQVLETRLNKQDVYSDRINKNHLEQKFTLPAVKDGSIIEYSYTITSDYNFNLPSWSFQSEEYPCLMSEYQVDIPQTLGYIIVRQGVHRFSIDKGGEGNESFKVTTKRDPSALAGEGQDLYVSARTVKHQWVMKDIPALRPEHYLSTPSNYIDRIEFQLSSTYDGEQSHDQMNNWKKATEDLLHHESFGGPLSEDNEWLDDLVGKAIGNNTTALTQARSLYYYVNSHFTCTNYYDINIKTTLRDVVKKNSGTVGDINLLLIAMLRRKGWQADPVVLSTREYGYNLASYPVLQKLNYVIARLKLDGKIWYLDAAHPQLGFGRLAGNCYNGHARIISNQDSASIFFEADSLKEKKTTLILLTNTGKGLEGSFQATLGEQESYNLRRNIGEQGEKNYFKDIQTAYGEDITISNSGIDSLSQLEEPLKVRYEFRLNQEPGASLLYINPLLWSDSRDNPFKALDRKYPVEMPYTIDKAYIFSMEIPEGYTIDEMPKTAKVAFNGNQGYFEYILGQVDDQIQLRYRLQLNKAWFSPDDYGSLRDFFAFVVKKENEHIVLKKK